MNSRVVGWLVQWPLRLLLPSAPALCDLSLGVATAGRWWAVASMTKSGYRRLHHSQWRWRCVRPCSWCTAWWALSFSIGADSWPTVSKYWILQTIWMSSEEDTELQMRLEQLQSAPPLHHSGEILGWLIPRLFTWGKCEQHIYIVFSCHICDPILHSNRKLIGADVYYIMVVQLTMHDSSLMRLYYQVAS
jgi:hypothetical protein